MRTLEGTMHTSIPTGPTPDPSSNEPTSTGPVTVSPRRRLGVVAGAGLLAGLIAAAIGGVAGAQTPGTTVLTEVDRPNAQVRVMQVDDEGDVDFEVSAEDEAIWDQFDQCLSDAGVDFEALDAAEESGDESAIDFDALDAAFESCETLLDGLSEDFEFHDISEADEAVFEQYDQCLVDNGVDFDELEAQFDELDDDADIAVFEAEAGLDAAFEACDPILENLSEDFDMDEFDMDELDCDLPEADEFDEGLDED